MSTNDNNLDRGRDEPDFGELTPQQWKVAPLIAAGMPVTKVAAQTGVSRETIWRYNQRPAFVASVNRMRALLFMSLRDRMWALGGRAMDVLDESLDERDTDAALDIFKTIAPGLRDVSWVPGIPAGPPDASEDDVVEGEGDDQVRDDHRAGDGTKSNVCPTCGAVTKSARGMSQHIKRKHGGR